MTTILQTHAVILVVVAGMALGVILQGRRLRGSCGLSAEDCHCNALQVRSCENVSGSAVGGASVDARKSSPTSRRPASPRR